jgi:tetratricopeptide (TPR) repeat protein
LRALGRLNEAIQVTKASLTADEGIKDFDNVAMAARNQAQLLLLTGRLREGLKYAQKAVRVADDAENNHERMVEKATLAYVLHYLGKFEDAEKEFLEANRIQRDEIGNPPYIYSIWAYRFSDLLIDLGRLKEARQLNGRALKVERSAGNHSAIDRGLNRISIARVRHRLRECSSNEAFRLLARGSGDLFASCRTDYLPIGHLAYAEFCRQHKWFGDAQKELAAALDIIRRCDLKLLHADWHLEAAALKLAAKKVRFPIRSLDKEVNKLMPREHVQSCAEPRATKGCNPRLTCFAPGGFECG